ncbi:PIGF/3-ketodihydrosphingosine reductase fusion protein [Rhododendron vialii]|uniref:PIGF/3-ketodihydrosphingosine reductase fusion protein n=1 Tax=Rhododendron vialii TaxID=182163 RepID=UPI00265F17BF|nr:PIGF/3-ketodihydrosphingosine reductase fusion protein [Rhododendron vialii]
MERKKKMQQQAVNGNDAVQSPSPSSSPWQAFLVHLLSGLGLASALGVAHKFYSVNLVSDPLHTLRLIWVIEAPIVILIYSMFRSNPKQCSYWKAVGRGILGLPVGAVVNALGAIALGAPVGPKYFLKTVNWSLLMSLFTVVPAASVFGSSWTDWIRLFGHTKPSGSIDYMICLPAHGAVIGAWFGAWPMPLDWDRPWQEWPICVSYGAIAGCLIAMMASFGLVLLRGERQHFKGE